MWGDGATSKSEHDSAHPYHTTRTLDVMYWSPGTTLSGRQFAGGQWSTVSQSRWDDNVETYTDSVLAYPDYLQSFPANASFKTCG